VAVVHLVDLDITLYAPWDPLYNDLNDPATISLTEDICNGVSNASVPLSKMSVQQYPLMEPASKKSRENKNID